MNSNESTIHALGVAVAARVPVVLWGAPGTGKSSAVASMAAAAGMHCETVIASVREPADFSGLPVVRPDGSVDFAPPAWARRLSTTPRSVLFLDELSTAAPAVQAALLRVVLDRTVGDLALPDDVAVIAAANPPDMAAGGWDLSAPLANRFVHLDWTTDGSTVADGLVHGFRAPRVPQLDGRQATTSARRAAWAARAGGFLTARPSLHLAPPDANAAYVRAWPSPRSWKMAIDLAAASDSTGADPSVAWILVSGCIGEATTLEFMAWTQQLDLPDPAAVLQAPDTHPLPERADQLYAVLAALLDHVRSHPTATSVAACWTVLERVADGSAPDVAATAALELALLQPPGSAAHPATARFVPILRAAGLW